jgi:hypothetical protein
LFATWMCIKELCHVVYIAVDDDPTTSGRIMLLNLVIRYETPFCLRRCGSFICM